MKVWVLWWVSTDGCTYSCEVVVGLFSSEEEALIEGAERHWNDPANHESRPSSVEEYRSKEVEIGQLFTIP